MIRLAKVELRRLFSRRLSIIGVLGTLIVTGVMLYAVFDTAKPLSDAELQQARSSFETAQRDWQANGKQVKAQCEADQARERQTNPGANFQCDQLEPRWEHWGKPEVKFSEELPNFLHPLSYLLAFAAFLVGAGFIGAEFSSGSIGSWLTFEPRRIRVYASKLVSIAAGVVPAAAVLVAVLVAGAWVIVDRHGTTAGMTGERWGDYVEMGARIVALASACGVVGAVFAGFLRHTAAALGLAAAYMVLVEGVFSGLLNSQQPWLVIRNVDAWVKHGTTYWVEKCVTGPDGSYSCNGVEKTLSFGHSAAYLGIAAAVLILFGAMVFRRRDIT